MFAGKPILGIAGGIGSGKSFVASLFGELGAAVIDSDAQARATYDDPAVRATLVQWWGPETIRTDGTIDRARVAGRIFSSPADRSRLEAMIHPLVADARAMQMRKMAESAQVVAFVWDTPLLFEAGLRAQCDAVVFVDTPMALRLERVKLSRGWNDAELLRREKSQWPLDKKRELSDYVISNTADPGATRHQVREVFSRIMAGVSQMPHPA